MIVQCGTAFKRTFLLAFDVEKKIYKQSKWILHDGGFAYLYYDPIRQRLFGLRDINTFTMILEQYNITTLSPVQIYTKQDGEKYAFSGGLTAFDYEENWIVDVRGRFESLGENAYFVKMDLNLVGKKEDIVTDFHLMPKVHSLCSVTYDIKRKLIFATWQHGSADRDLVMLYMNPYTSKFSNETLLLKTPSGWEVESTQAVFDERTRQILFIVEHEQETSFQSKYWVMLVDFDTMKVNVKKELTKPDFYFYKLFLI